MGPHLKLHVYQTKSPQYRVSLTSSVFLPHPPALSLLHCHPLFVRPSAVRPLPCPLSSSVRWMKTPKLLRWQKRHPHVPLLPPLCPSRCGSSTRQERTWRTYLQGQTVTAQRKSETPTALFSSLQPPPLPAFSSVPSPPLSVPPTSSGTSEATTASSAPSTTLLPPLFHAIGRCGPVSLRLLCVPFAPSRRLPKGPLPPRT
mmetsp:Transcript_53487/g.104632  ORF Transcript_53487/g.104632 Transcript_53487/m.104632 type:complete len:201 (-) Transcript_53487:801-1403(-)